jgi:hypothetical protein
MLMTRYRFVATCCAGLTALCPAGLSRHASQGAWLIDIDAWTPTPLVAELELEANSSPPTTITGDPTATVLVCDQAIPRAALTNRNAAGAVFGATAVEAVLAFARRLDDDDHARAVAIGLRMHAEHPLSLHGTAGCVEPACVEQQARRDEGLSATFVAELASLASRSDDPRVFTMARDQCARLGPMSPTQPHCRMLSARRWAAIEPGNGFAWLALAAEEPATLDEAMHQAALARRWDDHSYAAWRFVDRVDPGGGIGSMAVQVALMAMTQTAALEGLTLANRYCAASMLRDVNRRQTCERLAAGMRDGSRSVMSLYTGSAIAAQLGWPDAALRREEARTLTQHFATHNSDDAADARLLERCEHTMPLAIALDFARIGEVAVARARAMESTR